MNVFIDFEASSLSPQSWPIEVGLAWLEGRKVVMKSRLIYTRASWDVSDWDPKSEAIHGLSYSTILSAGSDADEVSAWLIDIAQESNLISDAAEFDQRWIDRLLGRPGPRIQDFDQAVWNEFSDNGNPASSRVARVYKAKANRPTAHRAGPDAADLAYAWRAGMPKR
jgi:DNA polymerase III epsilon subunit-like protein